MSFKKENIPNILTVLRIVLIPVICGLMALPGLSWAVLAVVLFILASVTDWFDGYLSRKWNVVSEVGRFLDPIADKLLVTAVLIMCVGTGRVDGLWIAAVIVILMREIFVSGLREFLGPKNVVIPVTKLAKWKTTVQMVALTVLILVPAYPLYLFGNCLLLIAAILTVITGWGYCKAGFAVMTDQSKGTN